MEKKYLVIKNNNESVGIVSVENYNPEDNTFTSKQTTGDDRKLKLELHSDKQVTVSEVETKKVVGYIGTADEFEVIGRRTVVRRAEKKDKESMLYSNYLRYLSERKEREQELNKKLKKLVK